MADPSMFDKILEYGIPVVLILIAIGVLWTKLIYPYVMPMIKNFIDWINGNKDEKPKYGKNIEYE